MWVEKKVCTPKAGMPNPEDHPGDPAYWDCTVKTGEACSDTCNIDFSSPAIDNYNPPGFRGGNEIPPPGGPGRGYPNPDDETPACVAKGQNVVIYPTAPDGGWVAWDEYDFGSGKPVPTETAKQPNKHAYTDPGIYDIKLVCSTAADTIEVCTKRIAVTCDSDSPPGDGGSKVCYDQCTADSECGTGMTCHAIPGAGYSRCVKNPDDSCEDNQECLCNNSCPVLPKEVTGVCQ
jgi:hypothetical protein